MRNSLTKTTAQVIDQEEYLDNLLKETPKKRKATDIICSLINYFSLIPTLIYNVIWYFYLKNILESVYEIDLTSCSEIYNWNNYALAWTIVSSIKAFVFLFCSKACFGNENDCNICCLIMKTFTSLLASIIFVIKIPDNFIKAYQIQSDNSDEMKKCEELNNSIRLFYKCEYAYILFILFLFCCIPLGGIAAGLKEYYKSRGYKSE
jgi:hypothetical protein